MRAEFQTTNPVIDPETYYLHYDVDWEFDSSETYVRVRDTHHFESIPYQGVPTSMHIQYMRDTLASLHRAGFSRMEALLALEKMLTCYGLGSPVRFDLEQHIDALY